MSLSTIRNITARQTTAGASEETLQLELDGAAAANSVAVAAGTTYGITDLIATGAAAGEFRLQQTDDGGSNWYDLAILYLPAAGMAGTDLKTTITITGSATTQFRMRVTTAGGAAAVTATLRGYSAA